MKFTKKINNFVGGYAHSGTRAIQAILRDAGIYIGEEHRLSDTLHDWTTYPIIEEMGQTGCIDKERLIDRLNFFKEDKDGVVQKREYWSCKNSEMVVYPCLDALEACVPGFTFILTMRNPKDNILIELPFAEKYRGIMKLFEGVDFWEKRMMFYNFVHDYVFNFFSNKKDRFLVVYLERLVANPQEEIERMFDFLGVNDNPKDYTHIITDHHRPESIGRHKEVYTFSHRRDPNFEDDTRYYYHPENYEDHWLWKASDRWLNKDK